VSSLPAFHCHGKKRTIAAPEPDDQINSVQSIRSGSISSPKTIKIKMQRIAIAARRLTAQALRRASTSGQQQGAVWRQLNREGIEQFRLGRTQSALKAFQSALQHGHKGAEDLSFAMSLANIAACLRRLGRRTEAEAAYRRAIHVLCSLPRTDLEPLTLIRACLDYGRLLEEGTAALAAADRESPAERVRRLQLLARAVHAFRLALPLCTNTPAPSDKPASDAAALAESQDETRLLFALSTSAYHLAEQFVKPAPPKSENAEEPAETTEQSPEQPATGPAQPWCDHLTGPLVFASSSTQPLGIDIVTAERQLCDTMATALAPQPDITPFIHAPTQHALLVLAEQSMSSAVARARLAFGTHLQTAEALSSLGALQASLGNIDGMRVHYSECLQMLHKLNDVDRFATVLSDFVELCVQSGIDQTQLRALMELLASMKRRQAKEQASQKPL
jgi:Flp pilus assembly protein TadD